MGAALTCGPESLAATVGAGGADVIFELYGHPDGVGAAVDPESVVRSLKTIIGSHDYAPVDLREAGSLLARTSRRDQLVDLVAAPVGLERIDEAITSAHRGGAPRVAITATDWRR